MTSVSIARRTALGLAAGAATLAATAARAQAPAFAHGITYLEVSPASAAEVRALLQAFATASRAQPGCIGFVALQRIDRPHHFAMVERWQDAAVAEAHRASARSTGLRNALAPALIAPHDERPHGTLSVGGAEAPAGAIWAVTHVDIIPPQREVGAAQIRQLAETSRGDPGCLRFEALIQDSRPNHFTLVEAWRDEAALLGHAGAAHTRSFRGALLPMSGSLFDERRYRQIV